MGACLAKPPGSRRRRSSAWWPSCDLVAGVVLSALGLSRDNQTLAIVGVVLLISGGGMLAWVTVMRNKPETL